MILQTHLCIEILYFSSNKDPIQLIQYCLKAMKKTILFLCFNLIQVAITCLPGFTWAGVVYPQKAPKDLNKYLDNDLEEGGHGGEEGLEIVNEVDNCFDCGTCEELYNGKFKCI